ncbi:hypothetical protein [Streptomyces sp. NPDC058084]|uniref:hypothetical protein n=1 Tax=Streptomyces sp. NPDC058084 TaxID=3346333 RepID=UPI0036EABCBF
MTTTRLPPSARSAADEYRPAAGTAQARRGRGRPPALTSPERIEQLLSDIRAGATVAEAAAAAGLSRTPVYSLRSNDSLFARALTLAQAEGRKARRAAGPALQVDQHGTEACYTKRNCPCGPCRTAGTQARARRRGGHPATLNEAVAKAA